MPSSGSSKGTRITMNTTETRTGGRWTLNGQLRTISLCYEDPSKSAYKDLQGVFDYNKTPMAVLGTKALAFVDPDKQAAWQSHGVDAFVVGRCPLHYCLLEFFNPKTRAYLKTGTYKLYPRHSTVPTINMWTGH